MNIKFSDKRIQCHRVVKVTGKQVLFENESSIRLTTCCYRDGVFTDKPGEFRPKAGDWMVWEGVSADLYSDKFFRSHFEISKELIRPFSTIMNGDRQLVVYGGEVLLEHSKPIATDICDMLNDWFATHNVWQKKKTV
jgi:hypothetical protein